MRAIVIVTGVACGACGDNRAAPADAAIPDARPIDAPPARPDLAVVGALMENTIVIVPGTFAAGDCEVVEGCVGAVGTRRLLRFDTVTANLGTADLVVGPPPPDGVSQGVFVWSPCHMHHHVADYARYELRDTTGVVVAGHKQAFCLHDVQAIRLEAPSQGYHCGNQGMSAGWADVYARSLPCQWVDITDVAAGTYTLHVEVNAARNLDDGDLSNNAWSVEVTL